jgi:hypothetical protein
VVAGHREDSRFSIDEEDSLASKTGTGIGIGSVLAIVLSWSANKSILWAIIHGFLSWFYVIYYVLVK